MRGSAYRCSCKLLLLNELHRLDGRGPVVHQAAAAFEQVRPRERRFCPVGHRVRLRRFDDFAPVINLVGRPVPKARPEAVQHGCDARPRDEPPGNGSGGSWLV